MTFWSVLPIVEKGSDDEASCERTFRARTRILADADGVAKRVSATWQEARDAMQNVKWYRHVLGSALAPTDGDAQEDLSDVQACLDAIVEAWPNMENVPKPEKKKNVQEKSRADRKAQHKGKGKGKGKGKNKAKGKG